MLRKSQVINIIKQLPEKFTIDELMERLILLEKIEIELNQVGKDRTLSTEQVKDRLKKWLGIFRSNVKASHSIN